MRLTLLANGVAGPIAAGDALDVATMLAATGRAIDPRRWVQSLRDAAAASAWEAAMPK